MEKVQLSIGMPGEVRPRKESYHLIIIGGGPAGLTAGIYAKRAGLDTVLLERTVPGGQAALTELIENYPGFPEGISGAELVRRFEEQARKFGLEILTAEAERVELEGEWKIVRTDSGELRARALIVATGAQPKKLGVPGEEELTGRGVSYCATCDGPMFRDKVVAVVGGGDTAVQEGIYLTRFAKKVYLIHRRDKLRAARILQERLFKQEKVETIWDTVVKEIEGDRNVEALRLHNLRTDEVSRLEVDGVFIFVGTRPNSEFMKGVVELDEGGYIVTRSRTETSVPGIFAAGDVQDSIFHQVSTAVGCGAQAAMMAERYLSEHGWGPG
ncbi:MAG TPA: thioredoxin-disulfide reductase [Candidatus Latescibacteria bacterium]|nr:thioredoxin-disulfide reductase [Candidatus Latescibacterota bacterium]